MLFAKQQLDRNAHRIARLVGRLALGAALALLAAPVAAFAQSALYAVDGANSNASPSLYRLDPSDGSVIQEIGPIGFANVTAIAFDPITGVLYGSTSTPTGTGEIITIDIETGAGTAVGAHGLGRGTPDLAFSPAGILYGWDEISLDDLVVVDINNGSTVNVGDCGPGTFRTGLEIDMAGNAYMKADSQVYTVDRNTGLCTLLVTLSQSLNSSLTFDQRGTLYSHNLAGGGADIYTVDLETGTATLVGSNNLANLSSIAFQPPPLSPLYAVDGAGQNVNPATLYRLDPRDGSLLQTIGSTGFDDVAGISFHPVTGVLYGTQSVSQGAPGQLITIDTQSGAGAAVGAPHADRTPDLGFAPSGNLYGWTELGDDLVKFDLTTGATAVVGECGDFSSATGLAVDYAGNAFMKRSGDVFSVDRVTGACTPVQSFAVFPNNILEFSPTGTPYTLVRLGGSADIHTLDFETGLTRFIGNTPIGDLSSLAFQPPPLPPLYATDGGNGNASTLYRLDPRDGSVIQTIGPIGFNNVTSLAFHPVTAVLYGQSGFNGGTQELITIDVATGAGTAVGGTGLARGTPDLGFAPSGLLYGWDEAQGGLPDDLTVFNLTTGAATTLGDCGFPTGSTAVAVDKFDTAWMSSGNTGSLYTVDRVTGACTLATNFTSMAIDNSLTFSPQGTAYAINRVSPNGELYALDTETGDLNLIGTNAIQELSALAFKPVKPSNLYAVDGGNQNAASLYLIDPDDGSVVWNLGPTGFDQVTGIAFHSVTNELYGGTGIFGTQELIRIDPDTGAGTAVGPHLLGRGPADLAFAPSGILYGWDENAPTDDLARFDLTTGNATNLGDCGPSTLRTGLAIDRVGTAYMKADISIYTVDRNTGLCTFLVTLSQSLNSSLTFDQRGTLYSHNLAGGGADIYNIDLTTGIATLVGSNGLANLSSLEFRPPPLPPLYATDGASGNPSTLYRLDPRDASLLQTIGPIGFDHVTGLAWDSVNEVLYGVTAGTLASPAGSGELLAIDRFTGVGAAVGPHNEDRGMPDLTYRPLDQTLYGWTETGDDLVDFDLGTGDATVVGDCGFATGRTGLAADPFGNLLMKRTNDVFSVDAGSGACTSLLTLTPGTLDNVLEFSPRGTMISVDRTGGNADFYTGDLVTGDAILFGSNAISNLAAVTYVPEPAGTLGLASGVLTLLALARHRRRRG